MRDLLKMWAIYNRHGVLIADTVRRTRSEAICAAEDWWCPGTALWQRLYRWGYRAVRVNVARACDMPVNVLDMIYVDDDGDGYISAEGMARIREMASDKGNEQ